MLGAGEVERTQSNRINTIALDHLNTSPFNTLRGARTYHQLKQLGRSPNHPMAPGSDTLRSERAYGYEPICFSTLREWITGRKHDNETSRSPYTALS